MKSQGSLQLGYRHLLRMAVPISMGTLLQFIVLLTDNFFLARLSENAINGAGNAGLVYLTLEMIAVGSGAALQIVIARQIGEGHQEKAYRTFRSGLALHLLMGVGLTSIALGLNSGILLNTIADPGIRDVFHTFFTIRLLGFVPFSMLLAFNALYTGTTHTWPILVIGGISAITNVIFDAAWVEGMWGFEPIGAAGAAWASLLAESVGFLAALALTLRILPNAISPWTWLPQDELKAWWKLAYPMMGQFLLTISTWTAFFFFVEKVGGMELKVSHLARNFFMLAFIVAQGLQQTTRTYVSGLLGEGRKHDLKPVLQKIVLINVLGIVVLCHGYLFYPELLVGIFFEDATGQFAMVQTLYVIFSAVCIYSFTGIMLATIQGSGATKAAFRIELFAVTLYIIAAASMTLIWPQPVWIIWRVEWIYFSSIGLGSWYYLRSGYWKLPAPTMTA